MRHRARIVAAAVLLGIGWTQTAIAQPQRMISEQEAPLWQAVGRLNIAGRRACTATLISPTEVITAAHCLYHPVTRRRAEASTLRFVAGQRRDAFVAVADVVAIAILPGFTYEGPSPEGPGDTPDLALLRLDRKMAGVTPLAIATWPDGPATVDITGYGRDRPLIASIREGCATEATIGPTRLLDCAVVPGLSGAPVVLSGGQSLVAVVSASIGPRVAGTRALVTPVAPWLAALRAGFD